MEWNRVWPKKGLFLPDWPWKEELSWWPPWSWGGVSWQMALLQPPASQLPQKLAHVPSPDLLAHTPASGSWSHSGSWVRYFIRINYKLYIYLYNCTQESSRTVSKLTLGTIYCSYISQHETYLWANLSLLRAARRGRSVRRAAWISPLRLPLWFSTWVNRYFNLWMLRYCWQAAVRLFHTLLQRKNYNFSFLESWMTEWVKMS